MNSSTRFTSCTAITVTFNNAHTLAAMFEGLSQNAREINQLIIVDNGSSDESVSVAESLADRAPFPVTVVASTNTGFARGYEVGRRQVVDVELPVLSINPDVVLAPGTLGNLLMALDIRATAVTTAPLVDLTGAEDSASRRKLPSITSAALYAAAGRFLPRRLRYNSQDNTVEPILDIDDSLKAVPVEATTGALMLLSPDFRPATRMIFDLDYWMYGEDLQLCLDAKRSGMRVLMVDMSPSLHIKGASSGLPRSRFANRAFHDALFTYYSKNLARNKLEKTLVRQAIHVRRILTDRVAPKPPSPRF